MQFLPIVAVFSVLLFSVSLASPVGKQIQSTDMETIAKSIVDELVKNRTLLAKNETFGPNVQELVRRRRIRCHFVKGRCICRYIGREVQLKLPKTVELFPAEILFNLTATLDDRQQPNKIKTLVLEGIKIIDNQKTLGPNFVNFLDFMKHLKDFLRSTVDNFFDLAKEAAHLLIDVI